MNIRIMSFNTQHCNNYITQKIDFDVMADAVKNLGADIIGFQEMRDEGTDPGFQAQTKILAEKIGFDYFYFAKAIDVGENNPYGNAIISRFPIEKAETVLVRNPDPSKCETRCFLKAQINADGEKICVCVTHFGLSEPEQRESVITSLAQTESEKCILMGDFNVTPESEILLPLREKMFDTAELFTAELLSFPSDKPDRKIDYIFTSKDVKVLSADIPPVVSSDHRPYIADIAI